MMTFFLKQTLTVGESIRYLISLTRSLAQKYKHLQVSYFSDLEDAKIGARTKAITQRRLVTFEQFMELNSKSKDLVYTHLFAKQLMMLPGVSGTKALAIVTHYPTPISLIKSYNNLLLDKEKEEMLKDVQFGKQQRRLGVALSKKIYDFYCCEKYEL